MVVTEVEFLSLDELYSSTPSPERAVQLRRRVNEILRTDLLRFAEAAERVLPGLAAQGHAAAEQVDVERRVNPVLFSHHWQIVSGLKARDFARVAGALGELARIAEDGGLHTDQFRLENLTWDALDREIAAFLVSSEGPRTPEGGLPVMRRLTPSQYVTASTWVEEAIPALAEIDAGIHDEFNYFISGLRLFTGRAARGVTSSRCWGKILLRVPDPGPETEQPIMYFLDHITHETSHVVLHSIMSTDPLITNGFTGRFEAPIRWDPRPLYGIYHAMFVLSRISRVLNSYARHTGSAEIEAGRDLAVHRFYKGYTTIAEHGELTPAGEMVLQSCKSVVDRLS